MNNYKNGLINFKLKVTELKKKYNFQGLWHVTDFTNLKSISDAGELLSRKMCTDTGIAFLDGANPYVINRANTFVHSCTRFYYRPKTPTLYDNEGIKPIEYSNGVHIPRPVYLLFSEELIYDKDTMFSSGNATNSPIDNTIEFFRDMDWDNIFHDTWFNQEERDYIINKRQAELLSKKPVNLRYLTNIIFRSNADLQQAIRIWGQDSRFSVNKSYFSEKGKLPITDWRYNNYIEDYNIEYSVNNLKLIIYLKNPVKNYIVWCSIKDSKGNNKTDLILKKVKLRDINNNEVTEWKDAVKIKFIFNYNLLNGDIIKIYINNILSIEETIIINQRRN